MSTIIITQKEKGEADIRDDHQELGGDQYDDDHVASKYKGTDADKREMSMLGKKQVLRRNFNFLTMLGFASTCIASWEGILTYLTFILIDGGTPLLFWGMIACGIGQTFVYASIAEMASMSPTAGGQYHWVSEFAPPRYQQILSYISGWLTAIGWQVYNASVAFLVGTIIQGLIVLNDETYLYKRWHGTLLAIAVVLFSISFNTVLASRLPVIEGIVLVLHILGFFAIIIPLWVMAPRAPADVALLQFVNNGGWSTTGLSSMVGLLAPIAVLIGYDCSVHMSEEIKDASVTLPRAIMGSVVLNVTLVFIVVVTVCFCMGDPTTALESPTGYPFIQIFYQATGSKTGTNIMTSIIIIMLCACAVSEVAAASRQIWSFSRDRGLPGHKWLSGVNPKWNIPLPAVAVTLTIAALLSLINIGSTVALQAITSLGALSTIISYYLTIGCLVWRRFSGIPLPARRWSLGRWGLPINIAALLFLTPIIFFITWPLVTPVAAATFNWSSVMLVGVLLISLLYFLIKARKEYVGPVMYVHRSEL
ncbi:hypothetical protein DV738_g4527, partial [Chaetothyriales sp. CBS 135597]